MIKYTKFGAIANDDSDLAKAANVDAFNKIFCKYPLGIKIQIPDGKFYFNENIVIQTPITIEGEGLYGPTVLYFDEKCGIIVKSGGDWTTFKDLRVESAEGWMLIETINGLEMNRPAGDTNAFTIEVRCNFERVFIGNFTGHGIYGAADMTIGTNTNGTQIVGGRIENCGKCGIKTDGGDGSAWYVNGVDIVCVGENGIYDSSMAGGTYVGCQVALALDHPYYFSDGQNTAIGCYVEGGGKPVFVGAGSVWINGAAGSGFDPQSIGVIFDANRIHGANYISIDIHQPDNKRYVNTTLTPTANTAFTWQTSDDYYYYSNTWYPGEFVWSTEYANSSAYRSSYLTGADKTATHPRGAGKFGVPELLLGDSGYNIKFTVGDTLPDLGVVEVGDVHYEKTPRVNKPSSWRCGLDENDSKIWLVESITSLSK